MAQDLDPVPTVDDLLQGRAEDFARMDTALAWLALHWRERPSLDQTAAAVGLSPHHFQRIFTRWAGVSPKTFVAALAHAEASARLADGDSVLDAALDVGLSGPSRLHDLFVAQEGVTPGQARRRGEGVTLRYGYGPSSFGRALVVVAPKGLCGLGFVDDADDTGLEDMHRRWPAAEWLRDDAVALDYARRIFAADETPPMALMGPPFHVQVWKALLRIPEGRTATYGQIAALAGKPGAYRATGAAIGANPISYLIPCHRAIGADGRLTGYYWGLSRKAAMLGSEAVRRYTGSQG
ncbi:methylated-DNA--[protein]-cysteine S-methyltransferase [Caulobacter sp. S45]|uniref:methylated-DNA--[protein]-cysteine S-methyltransferase n=1 Tax=Caulobacter sp. S45 TaxID=1641861 RepID=UPI00131C8D87|nr:methylated-DNA--[protein]-cysteine S-methyltransferase [Caulobacter sp. S45]